MSASDSGSLGADGIAGGEAAGERERVSIGVREWLLSTAAVAGVAAVALAQPLLDLYGQNPELFSASKLQRREVVGFALVAAFAFPLAWGLIALALRRFALPFRIWRALGISVPALGAGLVIARKLELGTIPALALAVVLAAVLTWAVDRIARVRSTGALLGLLAPATVLIFLFASPESDYLWAANRGASPVTVRKTPPIVFMIFDETNLPMLLAQDGTIDGARYPNLARLAGTSTWYRNAFGVSNYTPKAVPAILSSWDGSGSRRPVTRDYPRNLFTLLARQYAVDAYQPVTDMCPPPECRPASSAQASAARVRRFLADAAVVYGHLAAPVGLEDRLPSIDEAWGGFAADSASPVAAPDGQSDPLAQFHRLVKGPQHQLEVIRAWAARMKRGERPTVHFMHAILPHRPWRVVPDGRAYKVLPNQGIRDRPPDDFWGTRQRAQRYAMQAGAFDLVLGQIRKQLEQQGLWDRALVVVTADHGINLEPGLNVREPSPGRQLDDLFRVPLLIKAPGQRVGALTDEPAGTPDILPTVLALLGVRNVTGLKGVDLAGPVAANRDRGSWVHGKRFAFETGITGLLRQVDLYSRWFPSARSGWGRIYDVGTHWPLRRTLVPATVRDVAGAAWKLVGPTPLTPNRIRATSLLAVRVRLPGGRRPADGVVVAAYRGRVVATLGGATSRGGGWFDVSGVADPGSFDGGADALEVYLASGSRTAATLQRIPRS